MCVCVCVLAGGDGLPGFHCQNCQPRTRVFEMMRLNHNNESLYCNHAIASLEDLQARNGIGFSCNVEPVGEPLGDSINGIPISSKNAHSLSALFQLQKTAGVLQHLLLRYAYACVPLAY